MTTILTQTVAAATGRHDKAEPVIRTDPKASAPYSTFLVEDDQPTRQRLAAAIAAHPDLELKGSAADLASATAALAEISDCAALLVDLGLPDGDGAELIEAVTAQAPHPAILVISVFGDERHVIRAIKAGADGYLLKDYAVEKLADTILQTIAGHSPVSPSIARHLLKTFRDTESEQNPRVQITARERDVLNLIARGYSNLEIAKLLEVSTNTVATHTKSMYRKLAVRSRSAAVYEASQMGLISLPASDSEP
ncbi:MAG: response regulator [Pseudomonadales bacterium]